MAHVANLFNSPQRVEEAKIALARIITIPLEDYVTILNQFISDPHVLNAVTQALTSRLEMFRKAISKIESLNEYIKNKEYLNSDIYKCFFSDQTRQNNNQMPAPAASNFFKNKSGAVSNEAATCNRFNPP